MDSNYFNEEEEHHFYGEEDYENQHYMRSNNQEDDEDEDYNHQHHRQAQMQDFEGAFEDEEEGDFVSQNSILDNDLGESQNDIHQQHLYQQRDEKSYLIGEGASHMMH